MKKFDFKESDYNQNINYCLYVYNKNYELNLGLEDIFDIQEVADMYATDLEEKRNILPSDGAYYDDKLLLEVVTEYLVTIKPSYEEDQYDNDFIVDLKIKNDRAMNASGGYGFYEGYDDVGLDEKTDDDIMKL